MFFLILANFFLAILLVWSGSLAAKLGRFAKEGDIRSLNNAVAENIILLIATLALLFLSLSQGLRSGVLYICIIFWIMLWALVGGRALIGTLIALSQPDPVEYLLCKMEEDGKEIFQVGAFTQLCLNYAVGKIAPAVLLILAGIDLFLRCF